MPPAVLFAATAFAATPPRLDAPLRRFAAICLALLALLLPGWAAAGTNYSFSGAATVGTCNLSGTTYSCPSLPLPAWDDTMTIASGYTVNIASSVDFGYNQGLTMSGTAALSVSGNLDIGDIKPANINITGGTLTASGSFAFGAQQQTITANISAASATIGTGSNSVVNGNITTTGTMAIASHMTITGNLNGDKITTGSPVTLNGSVTATTSFQLANASKVSGNVIAPTLTMSPSNATISGTATVGYADLEWNAFIAKTIYCTGGTATGACDCVLNNSGQAVNTTTGPRCANKPAPLAPNLLHHLQIAHDGTASACSPETVTVTACANSTCTSNYTGGLTATLSPGGASVAIGTSGTAQGTVQYGATGTIALSATSASPAPTSSLVCTNTASGAAKCNMSFNNGPGLAVTMSDQQSDVTTKGALGAVIYDPNSNACVAAFANQTLPVTLACTYVNPKTGTLPLQVNFDNGSTFTALNSANSASAACDGTARSFSVRFDASGTANLWAHYPDVGSVNLAATADIGAGTPLAANKTFVAAPYSFQIAATAGPVIAGYPYTATTPQLPFTAVAYALTSNNAVAPNFGKEITPETVTFGPAQGSPCSATLGGIVTVGTANPASGPGVGRQLLYTEVGYFNLSVLQTSNYYLSGGVGRPPAVTSSSASGCGGILSGPAYLQIAPGKTKPSYYYSGQPIDFTVTAMNALGSPTTNYDAALGFSKALNLTVVDPAGAATPKAATAGAFQYVPASGAILSSAANQTISLPASAFTKGVATVSASAANTYNYTFATYPTAETEIVLRATEASAAANAAPVSSSSAGKYSQTGEASTMIRSGRIRIGNAFGSRTGNLDLPVYFEYYTGTNWLKNTSESGSIALAAIGIRAAGSYTAPTLMNTSLAFSSGLSKLTLKPNGGAGSAYVTINLGSTATPSTCLGANQPATTGGAGTSWLRVPGVVCASNNSTIALDPVGRASFGVYTPETKRIIHMREVFN